MNCKEIVCDFVDQVVVARNVDRLCSRELTISMDIDVQSSLQHEVSQLVSNSVNQLLS